MLYITGGDHSPPVDTFVQQVLTFAGGCCNYSVGDVRINRYATRYSRYCFDPALRRLAKADAVLKPAADTPPW